jgi:hypothetical protein
MSQKFFSNLPTGYDICLCPGDHCPHRSLCYRFLAESVGRQDYFGFLPLTADGSCNQFWDARDHFYQGLNREIIAKRAFEIANQNLSNPELYWLIAEMQLRIGTLADIPFDIEDLGQNEIISPKVQYLLIPEESIRERAFELSSKISSVSQDLHWLLAEQQIFFIALVQLREKRDKQNQNNN